MTRTLIFLRYVVLLLITLRNIIRNWFMIITICFFASETAPHMNMYGYSYGYEYHPRCIYLGPRGLIYTKGRPYNCPFLLMINSKTGGVAGE